MITSMPAFSLPLFAAKKAKTQREKTFDPKKMYFFYQRPDKQGEKKGGDDAYMDVLKQLKLDSDKVDYGRYRKRGNQGQQYRLIGVPSVNSEAAEFVLEQAGANPTVLKTRHQQNADVVWDLGVNNNNYEQELRRLQYKRY